MFITKAIIFDNNAENLITDTANFDLLELIRQRSAKGFEILYDKYSDALFSIITRIVANTATAEDLLQDTFVKIWKNIGSYDEQKGSFYTWMLNIARFTSIDYLRTKQHKNELKTGSDEVLEFGPDAKKTLPSIDHMGLRASVHKMELKYRQVIDIIYFYGYTYEETAVILDIPVGTVKTRARKAIQLLRNDL
ncbi:RNA polymerase sigma factor [Flavipsychrobacter stenotrophus]|uniref:RNA polymerase sigma factor n=1 Tax=Flavipsychrobacter stenotrophus TaxID=2077091 RepID=UPI001374A4CF|nr:sigma-70 family RNA polymerase sigma factor [Flavipsychrobacter stenotrophus]